MSILIRGMEMPKAGQIVLVEIDENGDVFAAYDGGRTKLTQHKAIPIPDHGDLIDRDALPENRMVFGGVKFINERFIKEAPIIIPAEEGEEMWNEQLNLAETMDKEEE